jgi:hypothetical protein
VRSTDESTALTVKEDESAPTGSNGTLSLLWYPFLLLVSSEVKQPDRCGTSVFGHMGYG